MRFATALFSLSAALLLASAARAATVAEIITSAAQAAAKLNAISYQVTFRQDTGKPNAYFTVTGNVSLTHAATYLGFPQKFLIQGSIINPGALQPAKFTLGFTGPTLRIINHSNQTYFDAPSSQEAPADHLGLYLLEPYFITGTSPAVPDPSTGITATLGPSEEINGSTCHHVIIKQKLDSTDPAAEPVYATSHEYFAASDFLLRKRITIIPPVQADALSTDATVTRTFTISNISTDPALDDAAFTPAIPDGFTSRKPQGFDSLLADSKLKVGDLAPDWDAKDSLGNIHTLSSYRGKVVLMDFWATWCAPCKAAMPGVQKLHEKFADKGLVTFGLSVNDSGDPAAYMKSKNYTYTCILNGENIIGPYGVGPLPQFFLIGKDGRIIYHSAGFDPAQEEHLSEIIQAAIDAP